MLWSLDATYVLIVLSAHILEITLCVFGKDCDNVVKVEIRFKKTSHSPVHLT